VRPLPDPPPPLDPDLPPLFVPLQELENEAPGTGYVHILSTLREMRGRGVGKRLLDFADRYRGPNGMSIIVADNNHGARRLYERCGYREAARRRMVKNGWQSEGTAWILMVKP
jgi:ribosomal protein S18 acetylase RimI-like enzyme